MRDQQVRLFHLSQFSIYDSHDKGRFELFLDLLYVAILANFAENPAEHASGSALVKYIVGEQLERFAVADEITANSCPLMAYLERPPRTNELVLQRRSRATSFHPLDHGHSGHLRK